MTTAILITLCVSVPFVALVILICYTGSAKRRPFPPINNHQSTTPSTPGIRISPNALNTQLTVCMDCHIVMVGGWGEISHGICPRCRDRRYIQMGVTPPTITSGPTNCASEGLSPFCGPERLQKS